MEYPLVCRPVFLGILMVSGASCFFPNLWLEILSGAWGSRSHQDITEDAILHVTRQFFQQVPSPKGRRLDPDQFKDDAVLLSDELFYAYYGEQVSTKRFRSAVMEIVRSNANMDFLEHTKNDPVQHFDSERIQAARKLLLFTRKEILEMVRFENYQAARSKLGQLMHSLQDFYSHSNWIEMGNWGIYENLVRPGKDVGPIAAESQATCSDCTGWFCLDNILKSINLKKLLTTGYCGTDPEKPPGKCSHGGVLDSSRQKSARGGINKDSTSPIFSPHSPLHGDASRVALNASVQVLQELWAAMGDKHFMRLLNMDSSSDLSFVLDTTGSMSEEITAVKERVRSIILNRRGTLREPSHYLLVPFNDPGFGPVYKTRDPELFMKNLAGLFALRGGDEPEMCLSAIQLALINAAPLSEIFVFTDASAKDTHLKNTVESLICQRKAKVTFLLTEGSLGPQTKRSRRSRKVSSPERFDLYEKISRLSGGRILFTTDQGIQQATSVIEDMATSTAVTLLHIQRVSRYARLPYPFHVDSSVKNVVIYISGDIIDFEILNPKGKYQNRLTSNGHLASIENADGFYIVRLHSPVPVGYWQMNVVTQGKHEVHVIGQSTLDFLYHFAVESKGTHPGLSSINSQPIRGTAAILVLSVVGLSRNSSVRFSQVALMNGRGQELSALVLGATNQSGLYVAAVPSLPDQGFSIKLKGTDENGQPLCRESTELNSVADVLVESSPWHTGDGSRHNHAAGTRSSKARVSRHGNSGGRIHRPKRFQL
ncbi:von Willebrand factor A domain-containing protein 7 isoform X2 [Latimeria chalumnae]|uniref:von Willebrand factor A domain-containing protein 7 isoform X2 n=1 Tax=Latimeria chalumnae TaxID=7897 RepID=UPI00313D7CE5